MVGGRARSSLLFPRGDAAVGFQGWFEDGSHEDVTINPARALVSGLSSFAHVLPVEM